MRLLLFFISSFCLLYFSACDTQDDFSEYGRVIPSSAWFCDSLGCIHSIEDGLIDLREHPIVYMEEGGIGSNRWVRLPKMVFDQDGSFTLYSYRYEDFFLDLLINRSDSLQAQALPDTRFRLVFVHTQ